jgi:hypothetical protein
MLVRDGAVMMSLDSLQLRHEYGLGWRRGSPRMHSRR